MAAALRPQDSVITAYRDHGWAYVLGCTVESKFQNTFIMQIINLQICYTILMEMMYKLEYI